MKLKLYIVHDVTTASSVKNKSEKSFSDEISLSPRKKYISRPTEKKLRLKMVFLGEKAI